MGARDGVKLPGEKPTPADAATLVSEARKEGKLARTSRFIGVSWAKSRTAWHAQIQHRGRNRTIGNFAKERDAAEAYDEVAIALRGQAARINFHPSTAV